MGTRGSLSFLVDGQLKTVYNHYDSYPTGLGLDVVRYLQTVPEGDPALARALYAVDENADPTPEEREQFAHLWERVSTGTDWYSLLRGTQGNPRAILDAGVYEDASGFPGDSLFCEWGYVIDYDAGALEIYKGFQDSYHTEGRFANLPGRTDGYRYYPIKLVATYPFTELPDEDALAKLERSGEDDD